MPGVAGSAEASNGVTGFDSPSATNSVKIKSPKAEVTEPPTGIIITFNTANVWKKMQKGKFLITRMYQLL